jgi:uncharacterized membrane protein
MDWEPWIHFLHVASAMVWVGGGIMLTVVGFRARRSSDTAALADFGQLLPYVGLRLLAPSVIVVLLTGLWLVLAGSEWNLGQIWVLIALAGFAGAFLVGVLYLSRTAGELERAASASDLTAARAAIGRWLAGYGMVLTVLLVVAWDMVVKPWT